MDKIITKTVQMIEVSNWDKLVENTYNRPYNFQQQNGCQGRGIFTLIVPDECDEYGMKDSIPEKVNGKEMGVTFDAWLKRDPKQPIPNQESDWELELFWERNFYPDIQMVANDLHKKGLLDAGTYIINIDW